jgi:hypothetical protein
MDNIWVYRKKSESIQEFDKLLAEIRQPHSNYCNVYTDQDKNRIAYEQMKKDICKNASNTKATDHSPNIVNGDGIKNAEHLEHVKNQTETEKSGILIVKNLADLGNTKKCVLKELEWIADHQLIFVLIDYPSTHVFDKNGNSIALGTLTDMMRALQENRSFEITSAVYEKGGRPRVNYPENWTELYQQWENGTLTAGDFLRKSGLKKGTFYHLVVDYKQSIKDMKERRKIG